MLVETQAVAPLSTRHNRFYTQGWLLYLKGMQADLKDRFYAGPNVPMTPDPEKALVIDADAEPARVEELRSRFDRHFYSPRLERWV